MTVDRERLPEVVAKINPAFGQFLMYDQGWDTLVRDLDDDLEGLISTWNDSGIQDAYKIDKLVYLQIKEKFGSLCVYIDTTGWPPEVTNQAERLIRVTENTSARICEQCGDPGETVTIRGWMTTLCDTHEGERRQQRLST